MKKIVFIGNSSAARECYWILQDVFASSLSIREKYTFLGFFAWNNYPANLKELASLELSLETIEENKDDIELVITLGNAKVREEIYSYYKDKGFKFFNLIHPNVYICPSAKIGEGNVFQRSCTVAANAEIGNGNFFNGMVNVAHDTIVGDYNFFGPRTFLLGDVIFGNQNQVAPNCTFLEKSKIGNENIFAPGSIVYKGCKNKVRMAGNPALKIGNV